jgi:hypothetical protein
VGIGTPDWRSALAVAQRSFEESLDAWPEFIDPRPVEEDPSERAPLSSSPSFPPIRSRRHSPRPLKVEHPPELQAASHLINLDLPWNPAVLAQRMGRVHRIGQRRSVNVVLW